MWFVLIDNVVVIFEMQLMAKGMEHPSGWQLTIGHIPLIMC